MEINVVDAPCGYGKTSWAIQYMNAMSKESHQFIYVTPFLEEVKRVKNSLSERTLYEPKTENGLTKLEDIHRLINEGKDICTTHALFKMATKETHKLLKENNYTLILDEVINVIEQIPLKNHDLKLLEESGAIYFEDDISGLKYIKWNEDKKEYDTKYNQLKSWALSGNLMYCNNTAVIWQFPCEIFKAFQNVFILTFLFHGQLQKAYYDIHNVNYNYFSVSKNDTKYELIKYRDRIPLNKELLSELITIYQGSLNSVGEPSHYLSASWFMKQTQLQNITKLKNNTRNYLMNISKASGKDSMWTVFKGNKDSIKNKVSPRGYAKAFVSVNERATNKYVEKNTLAYLVNRFLNPIDTAFFKQYDVKIDQDVWALSEIIQWVWRSRIRNGESIKIYIPSSRMRNLLINFLNSEKYEIPPDNVGINCEPSDWHL